MDIIWEELMAGLPDSRQLVRMLIRLILALILGAIVGAQRERVGKPAGLRTHMLVSMGVALFVLACEEWGMAQDPLSRVIQGLITGLGFLGGGAILKLESEQEIQGLTTAASIWMTAAIGLAAGLGRLGLAIISVFLTWVILSILVKIERRITADPEARNEED